MRNLILHHLEAIIESGSVIGACRRLFLSQPALSQYIKRLEAEYGIVIFDRSVSPWLSAVPLSALDCCMTERLLVLMLRTRSTSAT